MNLLNKVFRESVAKCSLPDMLLSTNDALKRIIHNKRLAAKQEW